MANALLAGAAAGSFSDLTCYSEVIQDSMFQLIRRGTVAHVSATALALSADGLTERVDDFDLYRQHITLRPQEISNHPEVARRLGIVGMNGMLEADIYGNVSSTHVGRTRIMSGIGGSDDLTRNGYVSMFMSPVHGQERGGLPRPGTGRSRRSSRWCRTSTTPSTTSR